MPYSAQTIDLLPAQIAVVDRTGAIVRTNKAWERIAQEGGLRRGAEPLNYLTECEAATHRGCAGASDVLRGIKDVLAGRSPIYVKTYDCAFARGHHWYQLMVAPMMFEGERMAIVMHVDVTTLQHDPLTGIANRALFDAQLDYTLYEAEARQLVAGVIVMDLDRFKPVNDRYGHAAGDEVLTIMVARLKTCLRADDLPARLGGDEFGVVLASPCDRAIAENIGERITRQLSAPIAIRDGRISVGVSCGVALFPDDGETAEKLFACADRRMYEAKRRARDRGKAGASAGGRTR